jgi:predicted transcriptional regulator
LGEKAKFAWRANRAKIENWTSLARGAKVGSPMRLADYLKKYETTPEQFSVKVGLHFTTVYRLIAGDSMPKRSTIKAIIEATDGEVKAIDFFDDEERKVG